MAQLLVIAVLAMAVLNRSDQEGPLHDHGQSLANVERHLEELLRRVDRLEVTARLTPSTAGEANTSRRVEVGAPTADKSQPIDELKSVTDKLESIIELVASGRSSAGRIAELALTYPEPRIESLSQLASALSSDHKEAFQRMWFFRSGEEVIATFGRPSVYTDGYWWYYFEAVNGSEAHVGFRMENGLVLACSGGFRK